MHLLLKGPSFLYVQFKFRNLNLHRLLPSRYPILKLFGIPVTSSMYFLPPNQKPNGNHTLGFVVTSLWPLIMWNIFAFNYLLINGQDCLTVVHGTRNVLFISMTQVLWFSQGISLGTICQLNFILVMSTSSLVSMENDKFLHHNMNYFHFIQWK